jgi:hypothetical protein
LSATAFPSSARRRAVARPMPRDAPVTRATATAYSAPWVAGSTTAVIEPFEIAIRGSAP